MTNKMKWLSPIPKSYRRFPFAVRSPQTFWKVEDLFFPVSNSHLHNSLLRSSVWLAVRISSSTVFSASDVESDWSCSIAGLLSFPPFVDRAGSVVDTVDSLPSRYRMRTKPLLASKRSTSSHKASFLFLTNRLSKKCNGSTQWCRRRGNRGYKRTPKILICWKFGQNPWKSGQICENVRKYLKCWENYLKVRIKMAPNVVWFWKIGPQHGKINMKTFFGGQPKKYPCGRKYSHKELPESFSGRFGEIRAKIFRTPKNLPAATPWFHHPRIESSLYRPHMRWNLKKRSCGVLFVAVQSKDLIYRQ